MLFTTLSVRAQDIDSNITSRTRQPGAIADQISDRRERAAFLGLFEKLDPSSLLLRATAFVQQYPHSAFLAQAYEVAAQSSFDTAQYTSGLEFAQMSLEFFPENPLLLVAVADVQARQKQNDAAIKNAQDALRYLDEFANPVSVPKEDWPRIRRRQQAIAHFAIGRAELQKALKEPSRPARQELLAGSLASLSKAGTLSPGDPEISYLAGMAHISSGNLSAGEAEFAAVYAAGGEYAPRALASLKEIYSGQSPPPAGSFEEFLRAAEHSIRQPMPLPDALASDSGSKLFGYAGSQSCKTCHAQIYRNWSDTRMARMLRPYQPQNVIGDFQNRNEYYTGDDVQYVHGKLTTRPGVEHKLFARMVLSSGRHYFEIRQSDGTWHRYPVDYTIGSKWQQAYATKLPNGQIHVFPIQYSLIEKRWINYWRSLDGPGTERSDPYNFERLDSSTSYQDKCAVCHTSQLRNTTGGGLAPDGLEFRESGVGCEMCHGPSSDHVAAMASGDYYSKAPQDPPVNFRNISNTEYVSICAQCHMQSTLREPGPHGELNYSTTGNFFLHNASVPFGEFTRKGFYKDGRFSQTTFIVEALSRTKCFQVGKVSCGTCHDPHGSDFSANQTSLRYKDDPDRMCTGCHTKFQDKTAVAAHSHHSVASEGSRCVSCHMPRIMDALTFSARTHQIDDIPNAEMTLRFGQQESPNACLVCHKEKTAEWVITAWRELKTTSTPDKSVAIKRLE